MHDVVVIGNGPFGAAATKYLARRGVGVLCVGAGPTHSVDGPATVFSSHNDAARLVRARSRHPAWAEASLAAIDRIPEIEDESGVRFHEPVGCLTSSAPGGDGRHPDPRESLGSSGVDHEFFEAGDRSWEERWPDLAFPETHWVAFEPAPAGYIRPLDMVRAQNVIATAHGAEMLCWMKMMPHDRWNMRSENGPCSRVTWLWYSSIGLIDRLPNSSSWA